MGLNCVVCCVSQNLKQNHQETSYDSYKKNKYNKYQIYSTIL